MNFDLKTILILLAIIVIVLSGVKKLFKLAIFIAILAFLYYFFM